MSRRLGMILELNAPEDPAAPEASRAERLAAARTAANLAKQRFLLRIEELRELDPAIQVAYTPSSSALVVVRSTEEVLRMLERAPEVLAMSPEREGELLAASAFAPEPTIISGQHKR